MNIAGDFIFIGSCSVQAVFCRMEKVMRDVDSANVEMKSRIENEYKFIHASSTNKSRNTGRFQFDFPVLFQSMQAERKEEE